MTQIPTLHPSRAMELRAVVAVLHLAHSMSVTYRETRPPPELARQVRRLWTLKGRGFDWAPEPIVPDGCSEVVLNFADPFRQVAVDGSYRRQPTSLLVGEIRRCVVTGPTGEIDLLGVRFKPGGAHALLGLPAVDLVDGMFDLTQCASARLQEGLARVLSASTADDRMKLLERALATELRENPSAHIVVARAVRAITEHRGQIDLVTLESKLGVSSRHLERCFKECVGISPKAWSRVIRFRSLLGALAQPTVDWSALAQHHGYFDQSHLTRDFKQFSGMTPAAYVAGQRHVADVFSVSGA